jgi:hypothetical protein
VSRVAMSGGSFGHAASGAVLHEVELRGRRKICADPRRTGPRGKAQRILHRRRLHSLVAEHVEPFLRAQDCVVPASSGSRMAQRGAGGGLRARACARIVREPSRNAGHHRS